MRIAPFFPFFAALKGLSRGVPPSHREDSRGEKTKRYPGPVHLHKYARSADGDSVDSSSRGRRVMNLSKFSGRHVSSNLLTRGAFCGDVIEWRLWYVIGRVNSV